MNKTRLALGVLVMLVLPFVLSAIFRPLLPEPRLPGVLLTAWSTLVVAFASTMIATACGAVIARGRFLLPALVLWALVNGLSLLMTTLASIELGRAAGQWLERPFLNVVGYNSPLLVATLLATAIGCALGQWLLRITRVAQRPAVVAP